MVKYNYEPEQSDVTDSDYEALHNQQQKDIERKDIINVEGLTKVNIEMDNKQEHTFINKCGKQSITIADHMTIVSDKKINVKELDVNDDIQREVQFYQITINNVQKGLVELEKDGVKTERPDDFMAQMFKHDKVMQKVKNKLVKQQVKIQNFEEKKMRLENKKFQHQLKAKQERMKHKEKRTNLQAIDSWKQEIKNKGEKAKDLSEFLVNRNRQNGKQFDQKKGNKFVHKKGQKQPKQKRPGTVARKNIRKKR